MKQALPLVVSFLFSIILASFIVFNLQGVDYKLFRVAASTVYFTILFYPWAYFYIVILD